MTKLVGAVTKDELHNLNAYWSACNYLSAGMIYLKDNALLKNPFKPENIKQRLLGHWGTSPGISFIYVHLNRLIVKYDLNCIFITGPGHGAPGVLGPIYLEGTYSEVYPTITQNEDGLNHFFKQFSFPGGIGSHCTPEMPGSINEGGELGYSVSHAFGAAFDNPDLIVAVVVGDGEAETGPLATSWHSNKFLNPITDGAVLPILHLNGYKINNPTILSRIPSDELNNLFLGYGWIPHFVEGSNPIEMHEKMASVMEICIQTIKNTQLKARTDGTQCRQKWPMIVLRSPKGWTGPEVVDGHQVEGTWRAHQVPIGHVRDNLEHFNQLENWLKSYHPETLFDDTGQLMPSLKVLNPIANKRMSANPIANGGIVRKELIIPNLNDYALKIEMPATVYAENTYPLGNLLGDIIQKNPTNFRVFSPDENSSNKLNGIYKISKKTWLAGYLASDADGGDLSPDGRVMEMLSEHTLEGWLEGYLLTGRHGFFSTYEAFIHVIDSMFNQHAKWLAMAKKVSWRKPISSLNLLMTSTVWRQDHNGFSHQDPGFLDVVVNKSPDVTRIYLPPDVNTLLAVSNHCLKSTNYINVIVCDKQKHLQYLNMDEAIKHCTKGIGVWDWASNEQGHPDIVIASAGDVPTKEALAAVALMREYIPLLKIRYINVIDLYKMTPTSMHPHGLSDAEFDKLFTLDKPIIFNFHGYPNLIHRLAYRRNNHQNLHVHGYREVGSINTPIELAIQNQIDRFSLVIDAIKYLGSLGDRGIEVETVMREKQAECRNYAYQFGVDKPEFESWTWPAT
jgi:xylulose-5-phosphate/fructose-6-phosphate phosphoketolase